MRSPSSESATAVASWLSGVTPLAIGCAPKTGRERVPGRVIPGVQIQEGRVRTHSVRTRSFWTDKPGKGSAQLLVLDGKWITRPVMRRHSLLSVGGEELKRGMSGSPILINGKAVAVVSTDQRNPVLRDCLPGWFFPPIKKTRKPAL